MKHTIKFRKAILDYGRRALGYYTISDVSLHKLVFHLTKYCSDITIKKVKLRDRASTFRCKVVVCCTSDVSWNKFVQDFLDTLQNMIEDVSIK